MSCQLASDDGRLVEMMAPDVPHVVVTVQFCPSVHLDSLRVFVTTGLEIGFLLFFS